MIQLLEEFLFCWLVFLSLWLRKSFLTKHVKFKNLETVKSVFLRHKTFTMVKTNLKQCLVSKNSLSYKYLRDKGTMSYLHQL